MDRTTVPYEFLKSAFYDQRLSIPTNDRLLEELLSLEIDTKANKIDHPPGGSKDLADALAGIVYGLTMQRAVWAQHRVSPYKAAPRFLEEAIRRGAEQVEPTHQAEV